MNNPFFSIIVPVFNTGKELKRCVDSVLFQSFHDFDLQMIVEKSATNINELMKEL